LIGSSFTLVGCGTGHYEDQYSKTLQQEEAESPYTALYSPTEVPDSPFKIRVPRIFHSAFGVDSPHPDDYQGDLINERRLLPMVKLPGFQRTFEGKYNRVERNEEQPYYFYLAAGPIGKTDQEKAQWGSRIAMVQAALKKKIPETTDWTDVEVNSLDGQPRKWKRVVAKGLQQFFFRRNNSKADTTEPGILILNLLQEDNYFLIVGWRISDTLAKEVPLGAQGELALRTVTIGEFKPAATAAGDTDKKTDKASGAKPTVGQPANEKPTEKKTP
jgi:hypothetical protein